MTVHVVLAREPTCSHVQLTYEVSNLFVLWP